VFFVRTRNTQDIESVTELGIPAIAVAPETSEEILRTMELIGEVIGAEEEAARLVELYKSMSDKAYEMTADVPYKPRAIVMGSAIGRVANMNMLQSHLIEAAGGLNMAKDIDTMELWPQAGVEMIFQWNPEYIFITNYGAREYSPEDIINDPAWQNIDAVKNKRVYLVGCDLDSWEFPAVSSVLGIYWMMSKMHPDIYSDEALEKEVAEFYKTVYGVDLTRQQLGY
jgi:ABC-type Fe3+-hydroxamate transport system substrate-binding protein